MKLKMIYERNTLPEIMVELLNHGATNLEQWKKRGGLEFYEQKTLRFENR